jgi:hypothetical protein
MHCCTQFQVELLLNFFFQWEEFLCEKRGKESNFMVNIEVSWSEEHELEFRDIKIIFIPSYIASFYQHRQNGLIGSVKKKWQLTYFRRLQYLLMKEGKCNNIQKRSKTCFVMDNQTWKKIGYKQQPFNSKFYKLSYTYLMSYSNAFRHTRRHPEAVHRIAFRSSGTPNGCQQIPVT